MASEMNFNLNDHVKVRITKEGRRILNETMPADYIKHCIDPYTSDDGWTKMQLHQVAHIFGPALFNGNPALPIETSIILITELDARIARYEDRSKPDGK